MLKGSITLSCCSINTVKPVMTDHPTELHKWSDMTGGLSSEMHMYRNVSHVTAKWSFVRG